MEEPEGEDGGDEGDEHGVDRGGGSGEELDVRGDQPDRGGEQHEGDDGGDDRAQHALAVVDPPEEAGHGERGEQLEDHQSDHPRGVHPEQELLVRVGPGEDDDGAECGLGGSGDVRGAVAGWIRPRVFGSTPSSERESA